MIVSCGVFRAVEARKPTIIAANTGFSAFVDQPFQAHRLIRVFRQGVVADDCGDDILVQQLFRDKKITPPNT